MSLGPNTPTLLALLTRNAKFLRLPTLCKAIEEHTASHIANNLCAGKTAVITGAASGIGAALARACASAGAKNLVLSDLHWRSADGESVDPDRHLLVKSLRDEHGTNVLTLTTDVGKREDILKMRDATLERFGAPHFLFNNAGVGMPGVLAATEEALRRSVDINLWSVIDGMRAFVEPMETLREPCHIVNTASLAGISESTGLYGLTKHAVVAATESVASELAWRRSNVRVAVVCPSYVASGVVSTTALMAAELGATSSRPHLDETTISQITDELRGLSHLVANGMSTDGVAELVLTGLSEGRRYIFTNEEHTAAALADRVEQLQAGGLPKGFTRRMEQVVEKGLTAARRSETGHRSRTRTRPTP